ncbi:GNAT family N-acetyltransferase [Effusibacillus dendaii]|uniref:N-acetyltransferase domain-containing protein n=1 Tax=Effusibacillus dendaii TaxID=2743772 RepID=A0A7I8D8V7_9BACL|nr:GNAT family N-acetyltransferase [Effusibacillus dendaii]BCJ86573.1 hypothetical protein skT53_15580 [Effusibacillus dendaii]
MVKRKGRPIQTAVLLFRPRRPSDDPFIIKESLEAMRQKFTASTGFHLTEQTIQQQIQANDTITIIEKNGRPIGFYMYTVYPNRTMYWSSLILVNSEQSKGIGRQVVQHIDREAAKLGVRLIEGHVQITNQKALAFWLQNGFQIDSPPINGNIAISKIVRIE